MILINQNKSGHRKLVDLTDMYEGKTAFLVGGAPSLKEQPLNLLANRGVVTMAINNAALHFRPTMWCSCDHPECYEPRILLDPGIMKFANMAHIDDIIGHGHEIKFSDVPNILMYLPEDKVPSDEFLAPRKTVPWYNNTLFVAIHILYMLGFRRIILSGSDLSCGNGMYAHATDLGSPEKKWNQDLYDSLVFELRRMKPIFDTAGLSLYDCSVNSRLASVYPKITMAEAVDLCCEGFPQQDVPSNQLPHCSKFAPVSIQEKIASWKGYTLVGGRDESLPIPAPGTGP